MLDDCLQSVPLADVGNHHSAGGARDKLPLMQWYPPLKRRPRLLIRPTGSDSRIGQLVSADVNPPILDGEKTARRS